MTVECVTSIEQFEALGAAWDALAARDAGAHVSQAHFWLAGWLRAHPGARPWVFVARRGDRLTAALPLCSDRARWLPAPSALRFIADGDSDYCGTLSDPDHPDDLDALWSELLRRRDWHLMDLRYVPEESRLVRLSESASHGAWSRLSEQEIAPYLDITTDWRQAVPKSQRPKLLRRRRQLQELGEVHFEVAQTPEQVDALLEELAAIHIARWKERHETSIFQFPQRRAWLRSVCHEMLRCDRLYLCRLSVAGQLVSLGLYFLSRRRLVNYMVAFSEEYRRLGPVHLLVLETIEDVRARGLADVHDFGRGGEEYKLRWARQSRTLERLLVARHSPAGWVAYNWAAHVKPLIWQNYRLGTALREFRRRRDLRRSKGSTAETEEP